MAGLNLKKEEGTILDMVDKITGTDRIDFRRAERPNPENE